MINKTIISALILFMAIVLAFGFPRHKYEGSHILSSLDLSQDIPGWDGEDVSYKIDLRGQKMNFLSHVLAMEYSKDKGPMILLLILDADNFHYPKTCVGGAGFDSEDLEDIAFKIPHHAWKAKAIYFQKGDDGFLTVYWMCINKKQVDWTSQKFIQLWYSLFNLPKTGVMVRLDIETPRGKIAEATKSIQELLTALSSQISAEGQDYLFSK